MPEARLLITDDREGIRHLLKEALEESGYTVYTAASGQETLNTLRSREIDLVFLDLKMSGMDGLETLMAIKKTLPPTKVVMMTAYEDKDMIKEAARWGASGYISKPFDLEEIKRVVERELHKSIASSN